MPEVVMPVPPPLAFGMPGLTEWMIILCLVGLFAYLILRDMRR